MKKGMIMKKVLSVLTAGVLAFALVALVGCGSGEPAKTEQPAAPAAPARALGSATVEEIQASGEITIAVFSDKSPFGYVDATGQYQGYDVYYGNRIGQDLGVKVNYVPVDPAARVESLESGKADIVLANFTVTEDRAQRVDFLLPYMKVALGAVSPEKSPVKTEADFAGKKIIVITGTTADTYFEKSLPKGAELVKFEQYNDAQNALLDGRGDVWVTDNTEAIAFAKTNSGFVVPDGVASLGSADTIAGAVKKGNTSLKTWLDNEIVALGTENFFHAAYEATLLETYGADYEEQLVVEGGKVQ
jgi:polar amino acid transport system substrate-binding protein